MFGFETTVISVCLCRFKIALVLNGVKDIMISVPDFMQYNLHLLCLAAKLTPSQTTNFRLFQTERVCR